MHQKIKMFPSAPGFERHLVTCTGTILITRTLQDVAGGLQQRTTQASQQLLENQAWKTEEKSQLSLGVCSGQTGAAWGHLPHRRKAPPAVFRTFPRAKHH